MKFMAASIILAMMMVMAGSAQSARGILREGLTVESRILGKAVRYTVYLPFDYETSSRHYPVVYLLHGFSDNDTGWLQFGEAHLIADEAIAKREIPPMIIVMPDGGVSWYINNHDGSVKYEEFFFKEFIPTIESQYRIRAEKQYRGVSGLSMGGFGSLIYILRHPEMFAACAAFSAGVLTEEEIIANPEEQWSRVLGPVFGPTLKGKERITDHFRTYSPIHLVKNAKADAFKNIRLYLDCGDDDFLYKGNSTLHIVLRDQKVAHEYRVRDGGHTWTYWRTGLADGLKFIGSSFHR